MEVKYPILQISKKQKSVHVKLNNEGFGKCTSTSLKKGYFDHMVLVDSDGKQYKVNRVIGASPVNSIWFWPLEFLTYSSRLLKADLDIEQVSQLNIDEFKKLVIKTVNEQKHNWESGVGVRAISQDVEAATSIEDVMRVLLPI